MNKYAEIIQKELIGIICKQPYPDDLTEEGVLKIMATVESALNYIQNHWVDARDYKSFMIKYNALKYSDKDIHKMLCRIDDCHQKSIAECEEGPEYRSWESLTDDEKASLKFDFPKRFATTHKTFNPNDYSTTDERNSALGEWLKFRNKEDYEAAKLANWGHEPGEWIGF